MYLVWAPVTHRSSHRWFVAFSDNLLKNVRSVFRPPLWTLANSHLVLIPVKVAEVLHAHSQSLKVE